MNIYLIVLIILFILAVSDLVVGVGNDAVNFLNSAFGCRVAPRHIILLVASIGVVAGTLFSSGMMEVARKGIFNPQHFYFPELMTIFLAVMLTDIIMLDFFNTYGLPTSTTVSIVFELLGSAFAVSIIKIVNASEDIGMLVKYINSSKSIAIIGGILLSIVVAFTVGVIIQFFTRLIFTFDYKKRLTRYGGIFGGISLTAITFFILVKGAKGAAFMSEDTKAWIMSHVGLLMLYSFVGWTIVFQLLHFLKVNILKIIVLVGTFALALAFAANDLVNFIGVPLAGLNSYQIAMQSSNPESLLMAKLAGKVHTDPLLLLAAGLIMIATLYFSKKARGVIQTSVDLSRQYEGDERFQSSLLSRNVVRASIEIWNAFIQIIPKSIYKWVEKRFKGAGKTVTDEKGNPIAFDLLRASVNLLLASILISIATSWKLPLSTTYVTFMVAMGTSLADKAWGRDSAVYRINGVITVIGGWFLTAFIAFTVAGTFAVIIYYGKSIAVFAISLLAFYLVYKSHKYYNRVTEEETPEEELNVGADSTAGVTLEKLEKRFKKFFSIIDRYFTSSLIAFTKYDRSKLKENLDSAKKIKKSANKIVNDIIFVVKNLPEKEVKKGRRYGKIMGSTQEISYLVRSTIEKLYEHINNNHRPLKPWRNENLLTLANALDEQIKSVLEYFEDVSTFKNVEAKTEKVNALLQKLDEEQVNRLRQKEEEDFSIRGNMLYLDILTTAENLSGQIYHLISVLNKNYLAIMKEEKQGK